MEYIPILQQYFMDNTNLSIPVHYKNGIERGIHIIPPSESIIKDNQKVQLQQNETHAIFYLNSASEIAIDVRRKGKKELSVICQCHLVFSSDLPDQSIIQYKKEFDRLFLELQLKRQFDGDWYEFYTDHNFPVTKNTTAPTNNQGYRSYLASYRVYMRYIPD